MGCGDPFVSSLSVGAIGENMAKNDLIVLAIGGNSLIMDPRHKTVDDQYHSCEITCGYIAKLLQQGYRIVIIPWQRTAGGFHPAAV